MTAAKAPRISVIMSVYNAEKTLEEAINSIINQTFTDWEFVICNDCSSDSSERILQSYAQKYPNKFVLIKNETNLKLAASLNRCLDCCSGDLIARMDADDISKTDRFEKQVAFLDIHPDYQLVGSTMQRFDDSGMHDVVSIPEKPNISVLKRGVTFCHATIMMRKTAYDALHGYTVSDVVFRSQDYEMWFRFYALGMKGYNIQEPLYYVREDINAIRRRSFKNRRCIMRIQYNGYKLIKAPKSWYVYPIVEFSKAFVPSWTVNLYRKIQALVNNRRKK